MMTKRMMAAIGVLVIAVFPLVFFLGAGLVLLPRALELGEPPMLLARAARWLEGNSPLGFSSSLYLLMFVPSLLAAGAFRRLGGWQAIRVSEPPSLPDA